MIAHNSAGPKMDIVVPYRGERTGYLADTDEEYAKCLHAIYSMSVTRRNEVDQLEFFVVVKNRNKTKKTSSLY